jgi:hypothetical protein
MAKKTRKQKQRAAVRRPPTAANPVPSRPTLIEPQPAALDYLGASPLAGEPESALQAPVQDQAPARRRVERLTTAPAARTGARAPQRGTTTAAMFRPLESEDAAIPFDRVPYVPSDLRRVAVMAACMVVLIIIAAVVVSHIVS